MKIILCLVSLCAVSAFLHPRRWSRRVILRGGGNDDRELHEINTKMEKLMEELNSLRDRKIRRLENTPGLKLQKTNNFTNSMKYGDYGSLDSDDDEDDFDIDEEELEGLAAASQFIPLGIHIIQRQQRGAARNAAQQRGVRPSAGTRDPPAASENFQIVNTNMSFCDIGGYDAIKRELMQCADLLLDHQKYAKYNVRVPKGLILEGPPGNGKTLLAKCFSGEINVSFIPVSGAQFQEKYVGVGASRIRELFQLAAENVPCIVFIDEIDALGRKRSSDDESHNAERDTTLNELLVALDGFKTTNGIFLLASTNRLDLLDDALTRPGRIDKSVYVGVPDAKTREAIINIHIRGKPCDPHISIDQLVEMTQGCSGAQIENLLNEAMLLALRDNRVMMTYKDLEFILTRILVGWQSTENIFSEETLYHIAIHEMGHAMVGVLVRDYRRLIKVSLNTWSPNNPGFTLFESENDVKMQTKNSLFLHLMVLLGGRIAEEMFFQSVSTGASHDLEQARKLAEEMVIKYGMGNKVIYPNSSNKYRETIDYEIDNLIDSAYTRAKYLLVNSRELMEDCARLLAKEHILTDEQIMNKINEKYAHLLTTPKTI
jgi:cell division protease FtsH